MSTHYATLGLPASASNADIRQAYRKLVWLTHPDRTPDPAAHERYLAVNDAYEVLSNPTRRASYDAALEWRATPRAPAPPPAPHAPQRPRAHSPAAWPRRPPPPPLHVLYAKQFARALPKLRLVAVVSVLFVLAVVLDCQRSERLPNERVRAVDFHSNSGFTVSTGTVLIRGRANVDLAVGDLLDITRTPWLGKVRAIRVKSGASRGTHITINTFRMVWLLSVVVLGTAGAVLSGRLRPDQAFSAGFVNCVGLFFLGICLLII
ncbi:J domain-containing protein [Hymenobacter lapidiphilus]|uniref:J domain-containing protein n=1 Tax=Hymenobacter sp. CCM 8763 TaxID=2303334 RepID=UPI000E353742|nr:J domain-containing protein [Hymenobacter sp. CCM 8763]RFP65409.1 J domain-containing protein [Hymenobacter sp. CCM 8763]